MHSLSADYEDYFESLQTETNTLRRKSKRFRHSYAEEAAPAPITDGMAKEEFKPSFTGSKHERQWIMEFLGLFYEDQLIMDVLRQVKGGKEATVYCCTASPTLGVELAAAKVYRPRMFRQLRNDAIYRKGREVVGEEGKEVRGRREKLAMANKTEFGQKLRHTTWLSNEFQTLERLYAVGADVPKPFASTDNAILFEYIGDEKFPAPALSNVRLEPRAAQGLFDRLMYNVELMLANDRVHGDLSAYNVLYWDGKATLIDFPQAVDPFVNPEAYNILGRDVERLCQYFARYGVEANWRQISRDMWSRHVLRTGQAR